jgi:hypothetical protein
MTDRTFEYLLNAMESAAQQPTPADHGYADARAAVLAYVADLEQRVTIATQAIIDATAIFSQALIESQRSLRDADR